MQFLAKIRLTTYKYEQYDSVVMYLFIILHATVSFISINVNDARTFFFHERSHCFGKTVDCKSREVYKITLLVVANQEFVTSDKQNGGPYLSLLCPCKYGTGCQSNVHLCVEAGDQFKKIQISGYKFRHL